MKTWLSEISYQWGNRNDRARYEAWYASLLHMYFGSRGEEVRSHDTTSRMSSDIVVSLGDKTFVLGVRIVDIAEEVETAFAAAFAQMRVRGLAEQYRGRSVHLVVVVCAREVRNLLEVRAEPLGDS